MEHREPTTWKVRRLDPIRMALAVGLGATLLLGLVLGGSWVSRGLVSWLHDQPSRVMTFRQIILVPDPPPWISSGRMGLLDRIQAKASPRWDEPFSVLDVDLKEVDRDFRSLSPWIKKVTRVRRDYPARLEVHVEYREPVALAEVGNSTWVIDEDGYIVPKAEIDPRALDRLIPIGGLDIRFGPAPDGSLSMSGGQNWLYDEDRRTLDAARLAAFIKGKQGSPGSGRPLLEFVKIRLKGPRLCLQAREGSWVLWGNPVRSESTGEPTADQKWDFLRRWVAEHGTLRLDHPERDYLEFVKDQVRVRGPALPPNRSNDR